METIQKLDIYDYNNEYLKGKIDFYNNNIEQYGDILLYDLGFIYLQSVLKYSVSNNIEMESIYFKNIEKILNYLFENSVTTRDFAEILSQGLVSNCENIVNLFIQFIKTNNIFKKINSSFIPEILDSYNQRVIKGFQTKDNLNSNIDKYVNDLIDFFDINKECIGKESIVISNTITLLNKLKDNDKVEQIDKIFEIFSDIDRNLINTLVDEWSKEMFTSNDEPDETEVLSKNLIKLIAEKYISDAELPSLKTVLENTFENENIEISQINLDNYSEFISNLSDEAIKNQTISAHINEMYARLDIALTNEDGEEVCDKYFNNIFEILLPIFTKIKNDNLDTLLSNIYENHLNSVSEKTEYFYQKFENNWIPENKELLPNYDLVKIVKSVKTICEKSYSARKEKINLKVLYNSIHSITKNNVIRNTVELNRMYANCLFDIWYFDIQFAYNNMQEFLQTIANSFNYYLLAIRNSVINPKLLEQLWGSIFKIDSNENIEKHTQNFILKDIYKSNSFYKTWMTLIKEKDINIFYNALEQSFNSDISTVIKNKKKITKTITNLFKDEQFTVKCGKLIFSYYIGNEDGTQKNSIALWIKDLLGIDAKEIINHNACRKISNLEVEKLKKIFTANTYLTNKMKKIEKNKKNRKKNI